MLIFILLSLNINVIDTPNDGGKSISIYFENIPENLNYIKIYRKTGEEGFALIDSLKKAKEEYQDKKVNNGIPYDYKIDVALQDTTLEFVANNIISKPQWFNKTRTNVLIFTLIFSIIILGMLSLAKGGKELFIRRIPALDSIDEAVGRSTEMGKPVFFIPGLTGLTDAGALASITILSRVAKKVAEYETSLIMPNYDPIVMTAAREVVKQAYTEAGKPDAFKEGNIMYLTSEQFGYAAGVDGMMVRQKPGAIFFQGYFFAESLILAETGHSVGAIQIAGTTATAQLPFFVAACDYTLIGEEMLAASSYISRDPIMLGTIKGEDYSKLIIMAIIGFSVIVGTIGHLAHTNVLLNWFNNFVAWF